MIVSEQMPQRHGSQKVVLVIDDEPVQGRLLREMCRSEGHATSYVSNGSLVFHALQEANIAGLVTDLDMPGRDGLGVLRTIALFDPELPVLIASSGGSERLEQAILCARALRMTRVTVARKPIWRVDLARFLESLAMFETVMAYRAVSTIRTGVPGLRARVPV